MLVGFTKLDKYIASSSGGYLDDLPLTPTLPSKVFALNKWLLNLLSNPPLAGELDAKA